MNAPTYIVTGGAGFVGSNLVAELLRRSPLAHVMVIDDFRSGSFANIVEACQRKGVGPFRGEVFAESVADLNLQPAIEGLEPTAVFHLAAITDTTVDDERKMIHDNTESVGDMIQACAAARIPLVYASSAATYGSPVHNRQPFHTALAGSPNNVYGFSKWLMELEHARIATDFAAEHARHPHVVGLRYFNVFGPGEHRKGKMASMVYQLAVQILRGQIPRLFRDGTQSRDQIFVDDVVDCTIAAAGANVTPGVYNLGSGAPTSFIDIVQVIFATLGTSTRIELFDMPPRIRRFYQDFTCADMAATAQGLHWKPSHAPLDAMRAYVAFLAENPQIWQDGDHA
jgi:ADP-L-glycero-D-manno-heptose 6-epimerase